jgi:PAS domain-containing protein
LRARKEGTLFQAEVVITALRDEAGSLRGFSQVRRDITARNEAEEALRGSHRKMADLKAALDDLPCWSVIATTADITYVNDRFCEISKYYMEELLGQDHRILKSGYHTREFLEDLWSTSAQGDDWRDQDPGTGRQYLLVRTHHSAVPGRDRQVRSILRHLQRHYQVQSGRIGTSPDLLTGACQKTTIVTRRLLTQAGNEEIQRRQSRLDEQRLQVNA